jgi:hypothetical protein
LKLIIKYYFLYILIFSIFVIIKLVLNSLYDGYFNITFYNDYFKRLSFEIIPILISVNVIAPILEELCFRLPLQKNLKIIGFSALMYSLFYCLASVIKRNGEYFHFIFFLDFFYFIILIFNKNKHLLIIISGLFFGALHLINFPDINFNNFFPHLFNIIPHVIFGILAAKIRIEDGLRYVIYFHIFSNFIVSFFQMLVSP